MEPSEEMIKNLENMSLSKIETLETERQNYLVRFEEFETENKSLKSELYDLTSQINKMNEHNPDVTSLSQELNLLKGKYE